LIPTHGTAVVHALQLSQGALMGRVVDQNNKAERFMAPQLSNPVAVTGAQMISRIACLYV